VNRQKILTKINTILAVWVAEAQGSAALQQTDLLTLSEDVLVPVFRIVFGLPHLRNLNTRDQPHFRAVDLGDDNARVSFQVTATSDVRKIRTTLEKFVRYELYRRYQTLYVYILSKKEPSYCDAQFSPIVQDHFSFRAREHILDWRDLLKRIDELPPEKLLEVYGVLESAFAGSCVWSLPLTLPEPHAEAELSPATASHFHTCPLPFVGPSDALNELERFVAKDAPFAWWILEGPGGMGKSRTALELCRRCSETQDAGFLTDLNRDWSMLEWRPSAPTLIVVDDLAAFIEEAGGLLRRLVRLRSGFRHPVRLLLLDRRFQGYSAERLYAKTSPLEKEEIQDHLHHHTPLLLSSFEHHGAEELVQGVYQRLGRAPADYGNLVDQMHRGFGDIRPLYCILAAFAEKKTSVYEIVQAAVEWEWKRWRSGSDDEDHIHLVLAAAMLNGASYETLSRDPTLCKLIPEPGKISDQRVVSMVGALSGRSHTVIPPFKPDLLAEGLGLFFLDYAPSRLRQIVCGCWRIHPLHVAAYLIRCMEDFPHHAERLLDCVPTTLDDEPARFAAGLVWHAAVENQVAPAANESRITRLLEAFPQDPLLSVLPDKTGWLGLRDLRVRGIAFVEVETTPPHVEQRTIACFGDDWSGASMLAMVKLKDGVFAKDGWRDTTWHIKRDGQDVDLARVLADASRQLKRGKPKDLKEVMRTLQSWLQVTQLRPQVRLRMLEMLADVHLRRIDGQAALACLKEAEGLVESVTDDNARTRIELKTADTYIQHGKPAEAERILTGIVTAPWIKEAVRTKALLLRAMARVTQSDFRGAIADFEAVSMRSVSTPELRVMAFSNLVLCHIYEGSGLDAFKVLSRIDWRGLQGNRPTFMTFEAQKRVAFDRAFWMPATLKALSISFGVAEDEPTQSIVLLFAYEALKDLTRPARQVGLGWMLLNAVTTSSTPFEMVGQKRPGVASSEVEEMLSRVLAASSVSAMTQDLVLVNEHINLMLADIGTPDRLKERFAEINARLGRRQGNRTSQRLWSHAASTYLHLLAARLCYQQNMPGDIFTIAQAVRDSFRTSRDPSVCRNIADALCAVGVLGGLRVAREEGIQFLKDAEATYRSLGDHERIKSAVSAQDRLRDTQIAYEDGCNLMVVPRFSKVRERGQPS